LESAQVLTDLYSHSEAGTGPAKVKAITVTPDEQFVISASDNGTIKVWDLAQRRVHLTIGVPIHWPDPLVMTPDGSHVVFASYESLGL
jgi:WD40 repeat protein